MSNYYKMQTPLQLGDNYIYPLTTVDQILLDDGSRLNGKVIMSSSEETEDVVKLEFPLSLGSNSVYPITSYDQVVLPDGTRWNGLSTEVSIEPTITSGTKLATISVNGESKDLYYQASSVTLNGTATTTANFYAPTAAGTSGYILKSNGSGAPTWLSQSSLSVGSATKAIQDGNGSVITDTYLKLTGGTLTGSLGLQYDSYPQIALRNGSGKTRSLIYQGTNDGSVSTLTLRVYTDDTGENFKQAYLNPADGWFYADGFYGSGAGLSSLNASNISSGTLAAARLPTSGVTAGSYGPTAAVSGSNGATINVPQITVDAYGRVTSIVNRVYTSVNTDTNTDTNVTTAANTSSTKLYVTTCSGATTGTLTYHTSVYVNHSTGVLYGACWNDYAEFRNQIEEIKPGYIAYSEDDGKLRLTTERLQFFEGVVSDTFGYAIGETEDCKTPIAVSGRALVYCNPDDEFHAGDCVCAGPGGLAYRMTREEVVAFPDRIVGVVSEIPIYETWGTGNVEVNGRIWIKVK